MFWRSKNVCDSAELQWRYVCGVCTDGAPAMMGSRTGFRKRVQEHAPKAKESHVGPFRMCACWTFTYSSEKCVGFHDINY